MDRVVSSGADRTFRTDHCRVFQEPREAQLGEFVVTRGNIEMALSVKVYLDYLGIIDSGNDFFPVSLTVRRPPRWTGTAVPEGVTVTRVMFDLAALQVWLLQLEPAIEAVLFHDQRRSDRSILRLLLELVDQTQQLDAVVKRDREVRSRLLRQ